jgi:hypothetical protein
LSATTLPTGIKNTRRKNHNKEFNFLFLFRSPFPLYYHAAWFTTPHHKEGFEAFLDTIVSMEDVWLVTNWQALQWVRDPTPLDRVKSFKPFQCDYPVSFPSPPNSYFEKIKLSKLIF